MVKINEFFKQQDKVSLNYDVQEDVYTYMVNDSVFYRKHYYPAILLLKKAKDSKSLFPIIDKACHLYVRKYNIPKDGHELLSDEEKQDMAQKIYAKEMQRHKKGMY